MRQRHGSLQGQARSGGRERGARARRLRRAAAHRSPPGCATRRSARGRRQLRPPRRRRRGRAQPAVGGGGVRSASRRASAIAATSRRSRRELREIGSFHGHDARCPVVHLELHTGDLPRASAFYAELLRLAPGADRGRRAAPTSRSSWAAASAAASSSARRARPVWLPYVEVDAIDEVTDRARRLGASVLLEPREGPAGWRSVVPTPAGGEIAFWQPKARAEGA